MSSASVRESPLTSGMLSLRGARGKSIRATSAASMPRGTDAAPVWIGPNAERRRAQRLARARRREPRGNGLPVDDVPPRGEIVRTPVLVLEVVGVLPDVDPEERRLALHHRRVLVRGGE